MSRDHIANRPSHDLTNHWAVVNVQRSMEQDIIHILQFKLRCTYTYERAAFYQLQIQEYCIKYTITHLVFFRKVVASLEAFIVNKKVGSRERECVNKL